MRNLNGKEILILLAHAFVIWAICGAIMFLVPSVTGMQTALIIHAIGAPIAAALVSFFYFKKFSFTSPLVTAAFIVGFIILVDFFLVALVIEKSLEMFTSFLGTWLPFTLIFLASYLTGLYVKK